MNPASNAPKPRVMICSDSLGASAGHIQASSRLARALADRGCEVLLVSGDEAFAAMKGFDYSGIKCVPRPSLKPAAQPDGTIAKMTPNGKRYEDDVAFQKQRLEKLRTIYDQFAPNTFISEFWPVGKMYLNAEMVPFLQHVHAHNKNQPDKATKTIAYVRDLVVKFGNSKNPGYNAANEQAKVASTLDQYFDAAIVRGDERFTPYEISLGNALAPIKHKLHYAGYPFDANAIEPYKGTPEVVVSVGGSYHGDAKAMIDAAIESRRHAQGDLKYAPWHFYLSPACPVADREAFASHAKEVCAAIHAENPAIPVPDFSFEENGPSFAAHLKTCKAAILRAGLSSAEAAMMGRPSVVVPYVSPADTKEESEQYCRAKAIANKLPFVRLFDAEQLGEAKTLANALNETYAQRHVANHESILGNGHNHAAEAVLSIEQGKQPERLTGRQP